MFKVGDRIKVKYTGATLIANTIHTVTGAEEGRYVYIDHYPQRYVNGLFELVEELKPEPVVKEPLVIEEGKYYVDGHGEKRGPMILYRYPHRVFHRAADKPKKGAGYYFSNDGTAPYCEPIDNLISEWKDEPVVEVKTWIVYHPKAGQPQVVTQTVFMDEGLATNFVDLCRRGNRKVYATKVITTKIKT